MIDNYINNPKSIKYFVKNYLKENRSRLENKIVVDIPAGNGATTEILMSLGAEVYPFDLFPEYFLLDGIKCERANIVEKIPVADEFADMLICQEGVEHFSDQLKVFKAFNRVLKKNGRLLITTPSYSNLAAKISYLLFESETGARMPPNEIDDIWMSDKSKTNEIYHGHIFLMGLQKLRIIGKLTGFNIQEIRYVRLSKGSLLLFPIFYPFILLRSLLTYSKNMKKDKGSTNKTKRNIYQEQLKININPANLLSRHTFIVFEKNKNVDEVNFGNETPIRAFGELM